MYSRWIRFVVIARISRNLIRNFKIRRLQYIVIIEVHLLEWSILYGNVTWSVRPRQICFLYFRLYIHQIDASGEALKKVGRDNVYGVKPLKIGLIFLPSGSFTPWGFLKIRRFFFFLFSKYVAERDVGKTFRFYLFGTNAS